MELNDDFHFHYKQALELKGKSNTLVIENTDRQGDLEIEMIENRRGGDSHYVYLKPEQIMQLAAHLNAQVERLKVQGFITQQ